MYLKIDFESDMPIYTQLRNQIVEGIAAGELKDGEPLPSVRQMAEDIGINMHTVNKAYNVLKQEGFVKLDRRKGAVIGLNFENANEEALQKIEGDMKVVLSEAYCRGFGRETIIKLVNKIYNGYEGV